MPLRVLPPFQSRGAPQELLLLRAGQHEACHGCHKKDEGKSGTTHKELGHFAELDPGFSKCLASRWPRNLLCYASRRYRKRLKTRGESLTECTKRSQSHLLATFAVAGSMIFWELREKITIAIASLFRALQEIAEYYFFEKNIASHRFHPDGNRKRNRNAIAAFAVHSP